VGPDGAITVPVAGTLNVLGKTREEATKAVKEALSKFYAKISVTVRVDRYTSNRIIILGQVRIPGVQQFDTMPTLLEALARAGGTVSTDPTVNLTHCAIVRGRESVAWIDLRSLLQGANLQLNLRLRANDLVIIPDKSDLPVYVLGQVMKPGVVRWRADLTLLDAIAQAGGTTRHANAELVVVSPSRGGLRATVRLDELQSGIKGHDVTLQGGDIIYLTTSGIADIGYVLEMLDPMGWVFLGAAVRQAAVN
jgi:polysaccharide export outer membrane protein